MSLKHKYIPFYMDLADKVADQSYCVNAKVGCVILTSNNVMAIGYNGTPSGRPNKCECEDGKTKDETLHAEQNALAKLIKSNESTKDSTMFITLAPCIDCAKAIYMAGVKVVYYGQKYRCNKGLDFLSSVGVICTQVKPVNQEVIEND